MRSPRWRKFKAEVVLAGLLTRSQNAKGGFFGFLSLYFMQKIQTALYLPPLRFRCVRRWQVLNPELLQCLHWQPDALTTWGKSHPWITWDIKNYLGHFRGLFGAFGFFCSLNASGTYNYICKRFSDGPIGNDFSAWKWITWAIWRAVPKNLDFVGPYMALASLVAI